MSVAFRALLLTTFMATPMVGCGPSFLETSDFETPRSFILDEDAVEDTEENRAVLDVVQQYRQAMVARSISSVKTLVANEYYENASTTSDLGDDWGNESLEEVFALTIGDKVREVRYDMRIIQLLKEHERIHVDYEYRASYMFAENGRNNWESRQDVNRLTLVQESGAWKISSGL